MRAISILLLLGVTGTAAAKPPVPGSVLRVRAFNFTGPVACDKYCWYELKVTEVLESYSGRPFGKDAKLRVAALVQDPKVPIGEFIVTLEPYGNEKEMWRFRDGSLKTLLSDNSFECEKSGGEFQKVCRGGWYKCVVPFPDGGQECADFAECKGGCYWESKGGVLMPKPGTKSRGQCRKDNYPCRCYVKIVHGKTEQGICAD